MSYKHNTVSCRSYIPGNLRFLRTAAGLRQEEAAALLHMSRTSYRCLENGSRLPDILTLSDISHLYDISMDYIIRYDIPRHMISMIRKTSLKTDSDSFISRYLKLPEVSREKIRRKMSVLAERDREYSSACGKEDSLWI